MTCISGEGKVTAINQYFHPLALNLKYGAAILNCCGGWRKLVPAFRDNVNLTFFTSNQVYESKKEEKKKTKH